MGDNRPPVYIEQMEQGEVLIIRASALGHPCVWELIAAGQGEPMSPVPNVLQRAFDEGNLLEPVIIKKLEREYGVSFNTHQSEGHLWLSEGVAVRYHSDGIGLIYADDNLGGLDVWYVFEIKALSNSLWQTFVKHGMAKVIPEYEWQMSGMMHGENLPGLWVGYNKGNPPDEHGNREPCPDAGKIHIERVQEPPIPLLDIQLKASLIKEGVYGEPIISSEQKCGSPDHWPCRYLAIRPEPEGAPTTKGVFIPSADQSPEVDRLVVEYLSFKGQYDESKAGYERARDQLTALAGEAGYIQTDRWWVPVYGGTGKSYIAWDEMSPELRAAVEKYRRPGKPTTKYLMPKTIKRLD